MKKNLRFFNSCLMISCLLFLSASFIYSQEQPEKQVVESLEFREVDIKDVLRQLAKQFGLNIVFSEDVSGLITVQLSNVTLEEALDSIITVNGFVYNKRGSVIKVTTPEEAEQEGKQTRLFRLNNADASKLRETLKKVLTAEGTVEADARSNSLVVTDSLSVINKIQSMIPSLDELTPQVLIEAKFIETSLTRTDKLGIDWTTTMSVSGSSRKTTLPFPPDGSTEWMKDVFPNPISSSADFPTGLPYAFPYTVKGDFTLGTLDFTSLKAILDFLQERKNTKLVANPRILTLNNQKAAINVGKVLSLPTYERNETTGNMEITGWQQQNVGVNLQVTPQISPDGHIRLNIKPEVSSLVGYASTRDGVNEGPITSTRTAETEVLIKDGQTVVIGGLIKDESLVNVKKIPILGYLPIVGLLFTRKEVSSSASPTEKTDLLIFVTARIIKDSQEAIVGHDSIILTAPPRPFKLEPREVK